MTIFLRKVAILLRGMWILLRRNDLAYENRNLQPESRDLAKENRNDSPGENHNFRPDKIFSYTRKLLKCLVFGGGNLCQNL